jgi:hypothetical protein
MENLQPQGRIRAIKVVDGSRVATGFHTIPTALKKT